MPGRQWIYVLFALIGGFFAFTAFWASVPEVGRLGALGRLPPFAGVPLAGGAVYHGILEGPAVTTALGRAAVAWIGVVTQTTRHGKGTYATEKCRLGRLDALELAGEDQRWKISPPDLGVVELDLGFRSARRFRTRYWLGPTESVSPIPDDIVARCHLDRDELTQGKWKYAEQAAAPGRGAEFAGCADGDVLRSCGTGDGVAVGHLSTAGIRALVRRMADAVIQVVAVLVLLTMLFTAFGVVSAVLALRAAAPLDAVRPKEWT